MNERKVILAVDDMSMNLRTIKVSLENYFDVRLAKSGEMALAILKEEKIALILLDIEMPRMSGFDFLEKVRDNPETQDVPVIFLTSHADENIVRAASKFRVKDYIVKPVLPEKLKIRVDAALNISL